ncbi:MAG: M23 family metallopeptidase [Syntrophobacterales bacterium]|nr:M23 family metallopeptidase [Syntrophobacterales bacterium]
MNKFLKYMSIFTALVLVSGGIWFFLTYYEGEKPVIVISEALDLIGQEKTLDITCTDKKCGLRHIKVTITQDGKQHILDTVDFSQRRIAEHTMTIEINSRKLDLHDGKATLDILAVDYSLRKNKNIMNLNVTIDTIPPQIYPVSSSHNINPGGSCTTVYKIPEKISTTSVYVNGDHFPAYPVKLSGKLYYICYFAIPTNATNKNIKLGIMARDKAGNISTISIPFHIRKKTFRKDNIHISQNFLERKIPEFRKMNDELKGGTLLESFIYINEKLRADNFETIQSVCKKTEVKQLWHGAFLRMKNAATMAKFGDRRTYYYKGKKISKSIHMGVDLASTKNALIEASNSGTVVFCGYLGIYGNAIIIDHGLGLFSFYAHLGMINVKKGQPVEKGEPIGQSDTTGLAGGDHLHFGIFVGNRFADPQEWWDPHWIRDNVERKKERGSRIKVKGTRYKVQGLRHCLTLIP